MKPNNIIKIGFFILFIVSFIETNILWYSIKNWIWIFPELWYVYYLNEIFSFTGLIILIYFGWVKK